MGDSQLIIYSSIVIFAVLSWAIYKYVLTSANANTATTNVGSSSSAAAAASNNSAGTTTPGSTRSNAAGNSAANVQKAEESPSFAATHLQPKRHPPHLYTPQPVTTTDQGVIPFKSTVASKYETHLSKSSQQVGKEGEEDVVLTNRKQRARLFAKLFSMKDRPPNRGSNIVVIIPYNNSEGVKCEKLQNCLVLLGTYYNLFLLVDCSNSKSSNNGEGEGGDDREMVKQFRNDLLSVTAHTEKSVNSNDSSSSSNNHKLCPQILPHHRIIFTTTPEGKIAFVRQLAETKLVLLSSSEEDTIVKGELERFGFRVVSYPGNESGGGGSALGEFLIS